MSFTPGQQRPFRQLVENAWQTVCKAKAQDPKDKGNRRTWYEEELLAAIGKTTTTDCNRTRDFETVMAHFEAIVGDSIHWQMKRFNGDRTRILHEVRANAQRFDCEESYMLGIAKQEMGYTPESLTEVSNEVLLVILRSLKIQLARQDRRGDRTDRVTTLEDEPF